MTSVTVKQIGCVLSSSLSLFARQSRSTDCFETTVGTYQRHDVPAVHLHPAVIGTLTRIVLPSSVICLDEQSHLCDGERRQIMLEACLVYISHMLNK